MKEKIYFTKDNEREAYFMNRFSGFTLFSVWLPKKTAANCRDFLNQNDQLYKVTVLYNFECYKVVLVLQLEYLVNIFTIIISRAWWRKHVNQLKL